jgi:hypothetical protein
VLQNNTKMEETKIESFSTNLYVDFMIMQSEYLQKSELESILNSKEYNEN